MHHRQPGAVHLVERVPQRPDGALEHRWCRRRRSRSRPSFSSRPACLACSMPVSVRSTSVQPVKRFSRFQVDSPWRISTSLCMGAFASGCAKGPTFYNPRVSPTRGTRDIVKFIRRQLDADPGRARPRARMLLWPALRGAGGGGVGQRRRGGAADQPREGGADRRAASRRSSPPAMWPARATCRSDQLEAPS